jgi:hypothetical protein
MIINIKPTRPLCGIVQEMRQPPQEICRTIRALRSKYKSMDNRRQSIYDITTIMKSIFALTRQTFINTSHIYCDKNTNPFYS